MSNFQSLTAIITGLQSNWVDRAMRKSGWNRLGVFEHRIFRDLKQFTSQQDDFKIMRQVVESIVDSKPLDPSSRTPSIISADSHSGKSKPGSETRPGSSACIPFIGILLSRSVVVHAHPLCRHLSFTAPPPQQITCCDRPNFSQYTYGCRSNYGRL